MRRLREVDSTNRYALDQARAGAGEGLVVVAEHQTAGRGRLGRSWLAPPGASLLASLLLRPYLPPRRRHLTTACVALATAEAVSVVTQVRPEVKWPNDLLVGGRKLAGVLAEAEPPAVVVGVGVNLNWPGSFPGELRQQAVSLNQVVGHDVDLDAVLAQLLDSVDARYGRWDEVADEYRRRCVTLGRRIRAELASESLEGTAVDVTDDGHLIVEDGRQSRALAAGDVVHLSSGG